MTERLDWTKERKAEFRRVMTPFFDDAFNCGLMKRLDFPVTEQDRINTVEASCSFLCLPDLDEEVIYPTPCLRCGAGSGCRRLKAVMEEIYGPSVPMTEAEKKEFREIVERDKLSDGYAAFVKGATVIDNIDDLLKPAPEPVYRLRGIAATNINEVVTGARGQVVVCGLVTRISVEDVNTPIRIIRRGGRRLSGPQSMLNVYLRGDRPGDLLCQVDRFNFERIAKPIVDHGRRNRPLWGFLGTVPRDYLMIRVQAAELIGNMDR
jgi:hypothetical protein